jgi:hypothetical protein
LLLTAVALAIIQAIRQSAPAIQVSGAEKPQPKVNVKAVSVTITKPKPRRDEMFTSPVTIAGTVAKPLPDGWGLWLLSIGARKQRPTFWPYQQIRMMDQKNWTVSYNTRSGDGPRELQIYIVGPDGQALMSSFFDINDEHLSINPGSHAPLLALTSDMYKACKALHVVIKKPDA